MNSTLFNFWLSNFLLPEIGKGKTVIMDNAALHKSQETQTIINNAGCQLIFLPPCYRQKVGHYIRGNVPC